MLCPPPRQGLLPDQTAGSVTGEDAHVHAECLLSFMMEVCSHYFSAVRGAKWSGLYHIQVFKGPALERDRSLSFPGGMVGDVSQAQRNSSSRSRTPALQGLSGDPHLLGSEYLGITKVKNPFFWFPKSQQQQFHFQTGSSGLPWAERAPTIGTGSTMQCQGRLLPVHTRPPSAHARVGRAVSPAFPLEFQPCHRAACVQSCPWLRDGVSQTATLASLRPSCCVSASCWCCACHWSHTDVPLQR